MSPELITLKYNRRKERPRLSHNLALAEIIKMNKKYVIVLCDGMADMPVKEFKGKTPMMVANKPNMDRLAKLGEVGLIKTVPEGMKPGSDVANLSVLGYNPNEFYTGRSPLEAVSMGIDMLDDDVALRCNLVTLSDDEPYENKTMIDYCAGDISTKEAEEIIKSVEEKFGSDIYEFYSGVSYRHCLIWHRGKLELGKLTPPHDISGKVIGSYLSSHDDAKDLIKMMKNSYDFLVNHSINKERMSKGKRPANSIWLWGQGSKPKLRSFEEENGLKGAVISAVDLLKGIGKCARMTVPSVEGATGYLDTNWSGKVEAALGQLDKGDDFVYIHIEAPDECGHRGEVEGKKKAIELIDEKILTPLLSGLEKYEAYKIMALPDHPTPLSTRTHSSSPVPYLIYDSENEVAGEVDNFNEDSAEKTGNFIGSGPELMKHFLL